MRRTNVVILGSTGTIGINTLKVIDRYPDRFNVLGLTAYKNVALLEKQARKYSPDYLGVKNTSILSLKKKLNKKNIKILDVNTDLSYIVTQQKVHIVVIGMSGSRALLPFLDAVKCGKQVAPANKEALVIAGEIIMREAQKNKARVIPVDSEQSAIFQCLEGNRRQELKRVFLTASGGALANIPRSKFNQLTVKQILNHPRWKMGKKITVDSATLMNKGFEILEAKSLFNLDMSEIEVIIHPEAIIHSMVNFKDGSIIAQLGIPDMRIPIQYALTYPERLNSGLKDMNFFDVKQLNFKRPDYKKFPALSLAIHVAKQGGTLPAVLNAADEEVVSAFLNRKILFSQIYDIVEKVVSRHRNMRGPDLKSILSADQWSREEALRIINRKKRI